MLIRLPDDERGMAMVIALIVSMVLLTLATVIVAQSVHDVESSGMDRRRLQSVNAAETPVRSSACEWLEGSAQQKADALAQLLMEAAA